MKLPKGERAIVDIEKLRTYCLNPQHPRGRNKARVFAVVGIRQADAEDLRTALLNAAINGEAALGVENSYGQRYVVDFDLIRASRTIPIRSAWTVRKGEDVPRLTSLCTMKKVVTVKAIDMHSVVALPEDLPEHGLIRGQVGTVVETWEPDVYEVEFCDDSGKAYAMVALRAEHLMRLHYEPVQQAA